MKRIKRIRKRIKRIKRKRKRTVLASLARNGASEASTPPLNSHSADGVRKHFGRFLGAAAPPLNR